MSGASLLLRVGVHPNRQCPSHGHQAFSVLALVSSISDLLSQFVPSMFAFLWQRMVVKLHVLESGRHRFEKQCRYSLNM